MTRRHFLGSPIDGERAVKDLQQGKRADITLGHRAPWMPWLWAKPRGHFPTPDASDDLGASGEAGR